MQGKKIVLIISALIALCAIIYLGLPASHDTGEPPKIAKTRLTKQQVEKSTKAGPRRSVEMHATEDNSAAPSMITDKGAPPKAPEPKNRDVEKRIEEFKATGKDAFPKVENPETQELERQIEEFKNKYEWDDPSTMNLAEYSINMIPEAYRSSGISAMIKHLNEAQQERNGAVDERILMQAIEKTMPESMRPAFQENVEKYKEEHQR